MIENLPDEQWRDIPGYEKMYRVSNMGRVMSLLRKVPSILVRTSTAGGYLQVNFRKDGGRKSFLVHRLVMLAFAPNENASGLEVNHLDFDIRNCCLVNLEWATKMQNMAHFYEKGKKLDLGKITGSSHHLSRLTDADVTEIRRRCARSGHGEKRLISKHFGISLSTLNQISSGKTWKHLLP